MFGGVLLKVDSRQLGVLFGETLYFKITDSEFQADLKKQGSQQFTYTRNDKKDPVIIKNWWSVPESALDNSEALVSLAERVLSQIK